MFFSHSQIIQDGLQQTKDLKVRASNVFVRPDVEEILLEPVPPGYLPLNGFTIFRYQPSALKLEHELVHAYHKLGCRTLLSPSALEPLPNLTAFKRPHVCMECHL